MPHKLQKQLKELGSKLKSPPASKDALLKLLKQAANSLSELDQSPSASMLESLQPFFNGIAKPELLKHQDRDVKLLVATCICEITRITAPEAPYNDDVLREIFALIVGTFSGLSDANGPSFGRRVVILETLARYRSCVVMLDLECYDLIKEMFNIFFSVARADLPENVQIAMETIMVVLIEESEDIPEEILLVILSNLGRDKKDTNSFARKLATDVIKQSAGNLEPAVKQFLISSISGDGKSSDNHIDYHEVIYDIYHCTPHILLGVIPYLTGELLTDQVEVRLKAVNLVGDLFAVPGSSISEEFQPIFSEFLKRLTDRVAEVRMAVLEHIRCCLLSNPSRPEASEILFALRERLLDFDENVRKQVVSVICDVACNEMRSVPVETSKLVAERLRDKSVLVKSYTMERLAEMYKLDCSKVTDDAENIEFDWIPGKILRCYYDKDFRSDTIEFSLSISMFPCEFSTRCKVKHWVKVFAGFDKVEVKALEKMLEQKQRLQQEMQKYLSLRHTSQSEDAPELQKKVLFCFKVMSRLFPEPSKAEELFQTLDQIKDGNIWRILTTLLESDTSCQQAYALRDELLKILGEKHRLYDFLSALSLKLSYLLFDKEHVQELLLEASVQKAAGSSQHILSCMNILAILARYCPSLFCGTEKDLMSLLKDDSEIIKEGILHVLAKAGGTIKEQLAVSSSSIDLTLETLCLEGSRNQAKYAVQALAAITKDDGLMSLSVLYKRLVDMLEEKSHLPAVLQSLGCIAQTAMPVFETRETEIIEFIKTKILSCSSKVDDIDKTCWDDRSELCALKIFAVKAMVKSYLPVKDAHLRPGIDDLIEILKNLLLYGEISKEITSSMTDKAHLKLASAKAILRLSRCWDQQIPVDVFQLAVVLSEVNFPQVKKLFLGKVHQYLKDRVLDGKYACAFITNMGGSRTTEFEEDKQNLREIIQMYHQAKARQLVTQSDTSPTIPYPECILPYLIHVLSHQSLPNIDECKDLEAYEQTYRQLYIFISLLAFGDEDGKPTNNEKENERFTAISCILLSIKSSEDVLDAEKSKNSHAICDLGISVVKRLAQKEDAVSEMTSSVTLPSLLYKSLAKTEENPSVGTEKTWLAEESSLAHFNSLKFDNSEKEEPETEEKKDSEKDNEIPLGKIMKSLKSQGSKGKRVSNKSPPARSKSTEQDVDVLKMVREINLDNLDLPSNGHGPSPSGRNKKVDKSSDKRKRPNGTDTTPVPVPKRRRSLASTLGKSSGSKSSTKRSARDSKENLPVDAMDSDSHSDSEEKSSSKKAKADNHESDLLVSGLKKRGTSKQKGKTAGPGSVGRNVNKTDNQDLKMSAEIDEADEDAAKSPVGSSKKRKRRSVAGLAKCTTKDGENQPADLIGCRIKVWWPLDKMFYEGVVKSYKKKTKQHEITYDDGDVEILFLDKERWELVDSGAKSVKKANMSKKSKPSEESSKEKSNNTKKGSKSELSPSPVKGFRSSTKKTKKEKDREVEEPKSESAGSDVKEHSNESDIEPTKSSHSDDADNDDSKKDEVEKMEVDKETEEEMTENDAEADSEEKQVTEDQGNISEPDEEGKPEVEVKEDTVTSSQDGLEKKEDPQAEDKVAKTSNQTHEADEENNGPKSPEIDNPEITPSSPAKPDHKASTSSKGATAEDEDEPLSLWKRRATKKSK
uniref:Uncharacterized protein n=1 Tax=Kalanchoe fedtschenkoi TaxID=63787 RepID=A0A7N0UYA4_KALFE